MLKRRIGFVGSGQMARALAQGVVRAELVPAGQIIAHDPQPAAAQEFSACLPEAQSAGSNAEVVKAADVIILAVKPAHVPAATTEMRSSITAEKLCISIAAGIPLSQLSKSLGTDRVVRVMPNTPCLLGLGASAFALGRGASEDDAELVDKLLGSVGIAYRVDESLLDAVTGLSGSGPGYVFAMIEALTDGGVQMGIPRSIALALAAQTVRGSAEMVLSTGDHPAVLRDRVTSPGGTTMAGLKVLEQAAFRSALMAAVEAATRRSKEMGTQ